MSDTRTLADVRAEINALDDRRRELWTEETALLAAERQAQYRATTDAIAAAVGGDPEKVAALLARAGVTGWQLEQVAAVLDSE